jgi:L-proline---[L-prolyl-carrier protein] ligase
MSQLVELLERSARNHAERPAVAELGKPALRYSELERASRALAAQLVAWGIGRGDRVAILVPKSIEAVISIWGVLRSGAAYVPIDPNGPARRAAQIAADCDVQVVLASGDRGEIADEVRKAVSRARFVRVQGEGEIRGAHQLPALDVPGAGARVDLPVPCAQDLAYILYTSGSTGTPKGVMISHGASMAFVRWAAEKTRLRADDVLSGHAPFHFDLSVFDLFASVCAGAKLTILDEETVRFPMAAASALEQEGLTVWYSVPGALRAMLRSGRLAERSLDRLRVVVFAGEIYPVAEVHALQRALPGATLFNWYGPTETNVCTYWQVPPDGSWSDESTPIGVLCEGQEGVVVDDALQVVPDGVQGELLISGPTLMSGYWGVSEPSKFVPDPRNPAGGKRFYRTGDLVAREPGGVHRYHGRRDGMLKVRGYRIEVAEVEAAIFRCAAVSDGAIVAVESDRGEIALHAFVVASEGALLDLRALRRQLAAELPSQMIPAHFWPLDVLPITSTGKLDRQSLMKRAQAVESR